MSVVITGIGMINSLGANRDEVWDRMLAGEARMGRITAFDPGSFGLDDCVVAEVKDDDFKRRVAEMRDRGIDVPRKGRFRALVLAAASECMADARLDGAREEKQINAGVILGTMTAGAAESERMVIATLDGRRPRVSDNLGKRPVIAIQDIASSFNLGGPMFGIDGACSSGAMAVVQACRYVGTGEVPWCLAGGAEAPIVASNIKAVHALGIVPRSFGGKPNSASRPFEQRREGYVPAEGACFLLVENESLARARGSRIYARVVGYAEQTYNAHPTRITAAFALEVMRRALSRADVGVGQLGWINAHATSTVRGDAVEAEAIHALGTPGVARPPLCSAPKSIAGHLLGGSGAFEAAVAALSLDDQRIPPTINLDEPDPACPVECVRSATSASFDYVLSNSFGFGGVSCSVVFGRV